MKFLAASQDKFLAKSLCQEFKIQGYEVFYAKNKEELISICQSVDIDIIVIEHMFDKESFFSYVDNISFFDEERIPEFILLSDPKADSLTVEEAFALGAWALFHKPVSIKKLFYAVEDAMFSRKEGLKRRLDERVLLMARVEFTINSSTEVRTCFSDNISFGGFFGVVQKDFPEVDDKISFKLILTDREFFEGEGKVAWKSTTPTLGGQLGFGVKFIGKREHYVKFLIPVINETRTRQIETSAFQVENFISIIKQSILAAKEKISKRKTDISFNEPKEQVFVMCRLHKLMQALIQLLYDIVYPIRELEGSRCQLSLTRQQNKITFYIQCSPGGGSFNTDTLISDTIYPLIESHGGSLEYDYNSLGAEFKIELPTQEV